jgi:hypothetical protein
MYCTVPYVAYYTHTKTNTICGVPGTGGNAATGRREAGMYSTVQYRVKQANM